MLQLSPRFLALVLVLIAPRLAAQPAPAPAPAAEPGNVLTDEQKALLLALDADIARLDLLIEKITDASLKATTRGFIDVFKKTRAALGQNFDQVKHDELKFELVAELQRMSLWLTPPRTTPLQAGAEASQHVVFDLEPSPTDPAEVKAALAALDDQLKRLDEVSARLPVGPARDAGVQRLKAIREARAALAKNFTKAGWTAILSDLKAVTKNS